MGNGASCSLTEEEVAKCAKATVFTPEEVKALWCHFKRICNSHEHINRT